MKNRKVTLFLLISVVVIWGILIMKIRSSVNPSPISNTVVREKNVGLVSKPDISLVKIIEGFRDPFTGIISKAPKLPIANSGIEPGKPKNRLNTSDSLIANVKYKGMVKNNSTYSKRVIVEYIDTEAIFALNDSISIFKLFYISKDSIGLSFNNRKYYIAL